MSTLQVRVEDYTGVTTDTTSLTDQLTAGAKLIVDSISDKKVERYSSTLTDSGSGVSVAAYRVVRAHKSGYNAPIKSGTLKGNFGNSASIHYPSTTSPVAYIENGTAYVLPSGGSVIALAYPLVTYSDTSITGFPTELEHGVVLYTAIQQAITKLNAGIAGLDALTFDALTAAPSAPLDASYSYTDAVIGTYTASTIDFTGIVAPTYTKPTVSLTAAPAVLDMSLISMPSAPADFAFSINVVVPTAPADASYSYADAVIGTYTATTLGIAEVAPTYTKPTTTFDVTNATTYIATEEDGAKAQAEISKQATILEQYGKDLYNELNEFNKELEVYKGVLGKEIEQARLDQERLMIVGKDTTNLNIQNEIQTLNAAIELYKTKLEKYQGQINIYSQQVNAEVSAYQQLLQKYIEQLNSVRVQIEKAVQEYRPNLERWQSLRATELQNFASDIQNELYEYNKETEAYRALIQKAVRQAELDQERLLTVGRDTTNLNIQNEIQTLQAAIELYKSKMSKYEGQIQEYNAQVNNVVGQYAQKVQKYANELNALPGLIQSLKAEFNEFLKRLQ